MVQKLQIYKLFNLGRGVSRRCTCTAITLFPERSANRKYPPQSLSVKFTTPPLKPLDVLGETSRPHFSLLDIFYWSVCDTIFLRGILSGFTTEW